MLRLEIDDDFRTGNLKKVQSHQPEMGGSGKKFAANNADLDVDMLPP